MAATYSPLLRVELVGIGDQSNTWGITNNRNLGTILEQAIAGTAVVDVTLANVTLSQEDGLSDQSRCMIIRATGTPGSSRNIVAPKLSKMYVVSNESDAQVVLKGSDTTGVALASGTRTVLIYDGTDFVPLSSEVVNIVSGTTGTLTADRGGTAQTTYSSGDILFASATNTLSRRSIGTNGQFLTVSNNLPVWSNLPSINLSSQVTNVLPSANGGTNNAFFAVSGPAASLKTYTFPDENMSVGYRSIPQSGGPKTSGYTLATSDVGKLIEVGTSGSITVPNGTFTAGDAVLIVNNTAGNITITCSIATAYIAGLNTSKSTITLATRGVANVLFISGTACIVTGNVS